MVVKKIQDSVEADELFRKMQQDQKARRDQYWQALYLMRQEYLQDNKGNYDLTARPTMHYWAQLKYGFKMGLDGQGNYTQEYEVVEPKKFMLFQLKYMK